jgi:hypothetical protein
MVATDTFGGGILHAEAVAVVLLAGQVRLVAVDLVLDQTLVQQVMELLTQDRAPEQVISVPEEH